jgi:transposase
LRAKEQDDPEVKQQRENWREKQPTLEPQRLFFLDETNVNTKMTRGYGRAPEGERVIDAIPQRFWASTTLLSVLGWEGPVANFVYEGGTDLAVFETFATSQLSQVLRPGDILVMDNMATHKSPTIHRLLEGMGVRVELLPPYSPDYNPIENMFAKMKAYLKKVMQNATKPLWQLVGDALNLITASDATNFYAHCGYRGAPTGVC